MDVKEDTAVKDVLLVGFGAVGVIYSLVLKRSGKARVTVVARSNFEAVERDGIHIKSEKYGEIPNWRPDRLCRSLNEALDKPYSYVLVATKVVPGFSSTAKILAPMLSTEYANKYGQPTYVLLQNGLGIEDELYDVAAKLNCGKPRILSCTINIGTNLVGEREVMHSNFDRLVVGLFKPGNYTNLTQTTEEIELLNDIGDMFSTGGSDVTLVPEIQRHRFYKNFWNLAFSSIATATRYPVRAIFQEPEVEKIAVPVVRAIMEEMLAVGRALGFDEEAIPSSVVEDTIRSTGDIHRKPDSKHKASMLLDVELGKPLEVEVIVGEVLRRGKAVGVDTPRIELLYTLLSIIQGQLIKNLNSQKKQ